MVEAIKVLTSQEFKTLHEIIGEVLSQGYKFRSVDSEETISDMNVIRQKLFSVLK